MSRTSTHKTDESTLTTLCPRCLNAFRNTRAFASAVQTPISSPRSLAPTARPTSATITTSSPPARNPPTLRRDGSMMNLNALKIDPEFQGKIPPLNAEEEHILEQNMIQERRLLNPIIVWNGYILDGHSRYRILKHHPEIAFEVKEIQLPDRYAALAWICQNQLGRRNLDPERRKFLMGKTYENEKLSVGGSTHREHDESGKFTSCRQNVHMRSTEKRTCERIANKNGVSSKFVQRAEKYAKGVDAAEAAVPGAMEEILTGHIKATDAEITALAQTPKEEIPAIIKELRKPKKDRKAKKPTSPENPMLLPTMLLIPMKSIPRMKLSQ